MHAMTQPTFDTGTRWGLVKFLKARDAAEFSTDGVIVMARGSEKKIYGRGPNGRWVKVAA